MSYHNLNRVTQWVPALCGLIICLTPTLAWYHYDHFFVDGESALFWLFTLDFCGTQYYFPPPLSLPLMGCAFYSMTSNIEMASLLVAVVIGTGVFAFTRGALKTIECPTPNLAALCIVMHPAYQLLYSQFEYELAWHLAMSLLFFSFLKLWQLPSKLWIFAFWGAALIGLESRALEATAFTTFLGGALFFKHQNGSSKRSLQLLGLSLIGSITIWLFLRFPDIEETMVLGLKRDDPGGHFFPMSSHGPGLRYIFHELILRLFGPLLPALLILTMLKPPRDWALPALLAFPTLALVLLGLFVEDYPPHYFTAIALSMYFALFAAINSRVSKSLMIVALTPVLVIHLSTLASKAFSIKALDPLGNFWPSPHITAFRDQSLKSEYLASFDYDWGLDGNPVHFIRWVSTTDPLPNAEDLSASEFVVSSYNSVPILRALPDSRVEVVPPNEHIVIYSRFLPISQIQYREFLDRAAQIAKQLDRSLVRRPSPIKGTENSVVPEVIILPLQEERPSSPEQ